MTDSSKKPIDGRSLRKTGRTEQLATKVRPEIKAMIYELAQSYGMPINEIIEQSIEATYSQKIQNLSTVKSI